MRVMIVLAMLGATTLGAANFSGHFPFASSEQVARSRQDRAENPSRYAYNPLQVGNKWFYSGWYEDYDGDHPINHFCGREVSADSLINDVTHYWVESGYTFEWFWEYNQGDSLIVWDNGPYSQPCNDELFWVFTPGATFIPYWSGGWEMTCEPYGLIEVFGQTVMSVIFNPVVSNPVLWAEVFGPVATMFDFGELYLDGCVIDGVSYGYTDIQDESLPPAPGIELSCYPNPFSRELNISLKLPENRPQGAVLSCYNLKGQIIRSWPANASHNLVWDGSDAIFRQLSPGLYFLKATSGRQTTVKKCLKLR
ncbi:MAG: T9SS type A sorting domain-containing protein [Candidatus Syntrophosphaera sp.]|nr:T9SS type A sorting domain-containing protein [Candidatus Syntrophosphaera sp.]